MVGIYGNANVSRLLDWLAVPNNVTFKGTYFASNLSCTFVNEVDIQVLYSTVGF